MERQGWERTVRGGDGKRGRQARSEYLVPKAAYVCRYCVWVSVCVCASLRACVCVFLLAYSHSSIMINKSTTSLLPSTPLLAPVIDTHTSSVQLAPIYSPSGNEATVGTSWQLCRPEFLFSICYIGPPQWDPFYLRDKTTSIPLFLPEHCICQFHYPLQFSLTSSFCPLSPKWCDMETSRYTI